MNTTQPLNKILFLLDEISQCKQRISIATEITRDIEIAVLQAKTVELYSEILSYNRQTLQPTTPTTQIPVNHYQAAPVKETQSAPKQETPAPVKHEPVMEKTAPVTEKPEPVKEAPKQVFETPQVEKQPKPIHPQNPPSPVENKPVREENIQPQTPRRDVADFERKREKLLREEEENKISQPNVNQKVAQLETQQARQPEPVQQIPVEQKADPAPRPVEQTQPEEQQPQAQPEPSKPNVSQLYAQSRERAASGGTEKSLNEKLATQQTSLNDKFQSNVKKNLADKLKLSPISDLRTAININQRVAFINRLFKGDDKEFKNVVGTVNGFRNFSEAKFYVQSEVAPRYSWNENDETVQEFMELVYRKFL